MPKEVENKTYYPTTEACEMAGISRGTLLHWIREGIIDEVELRDRNGRRLFNEKEVKKLKAEKSEASNILLFAKA